MSTETFLPEFLKPDDYFNRRGEPNHSWIKSIMLPEYKSDEVLCLHPRIIINPLLPDLLAKYRVLITPDHRTVFSNRSRSYFSLNLRSFSVSANLITYDNYKESYVLDEDSGETFPVYLLVPCNHCELCAKSKRDAFAHRCVLETMCYDSLPWFLTLTYRDSCVPDEGVKVEDIQLFLKRFRMNLERAGYAEYFRCHYFAEYSPAGRPHYHMLVWNVHPKIKFHYHRLFKIAEKSWGLGFIYNELVSPKKRNNMKHPEKCFEYVAKYIGKGSHVPPGKNRTFNHGSTAAGGIGAPFLDKFVIPTIRHSLNTGFQYLDIFDGRPAQLYFHRYILSRCFPTFSQSIPYKFRKAYILLQKSDAALNHRYRHADVDRWLTLLHNDLPTYPLEQSDFVGQVPACLREYNCPLYTQEIDRCLRILNDLIPRCDFSKARDLHQKRHLFVSKMMRDRKPRDLCDIAYKERQARERQEAKLTELPPILESVFMAYDD